MDENATQIDADRPIVSVVMPCLNEEQAIGPCIDQIMRVFADHGIRGEVVVSDNGSTDASASIARARGAVVVHEPMRGYGNAYMRGFEAARGDFFIMGDADGTYDFGLIPVFLEYLRDRGFEFVTGSRYLGDGGRNIKWLHRTFGNPALTRTLNFMFGTKYTDVYCGMRAFTRRAYERIHPISQGMEYNLELAINAGLADLRIAEIPIQLAPRVGESKLSTFRDGWRSLRMMLLYCPNKVFLWPGFAVLNLGMFTHLFSLLGLAPRALARWNAPIAITATMLSVVGFQILSLGLHVKTYSWAARFDKDNIFLERFYKVFNLEFGLVSGLILFLSGAAVFIAALLRWLDYTASEMPRAEQAAFASTLIIFGVEMIFTSLFISATSMKRGG